MKENERIKEYIKPTLDVVELRVEERVATCYPGTNQSCLASGTTPGTNSNCHTTNVSNS
jgi:hypothetical protein